MIDDVFYFFWYKLIWYALWRKEKVC